MRLCFCLSCFASLALGGELERFVHTRPTLGTLTRIVLYAPDADAGRVAADAAFARIEALNKSLSDYLEDSELNQLCAQAGNGQAVKVSAELFEILQYAVEVAQASGGAFDVTIGPVTRLWRVAREKEKKPTDAEIARAKELVDWQNLKLDAEARTAQLLKAGMKLDLGGLGKGFIADHALAALKTKGIARALVACGGDIVVSDAPPGSEGWTVAIAPLKGKGDEKRYLLLKNAAVSTAGDAEQFLEADGEHYSHIVDPKTGVGMTRHSSISVVAPRGLQSDALDTAISVMGVERGMALIDGMPGIAALAVEQTDTGVKVTESKRWKAIPKKNLNNQDAKK